MANSRLSNPAIEAALTDPGFAIDPYSTYELLRTDAPVYWSDAFNAWIVSRYSDVVDVLRDWRTFSNSGRISSLLASFSDTDRARFSAIEEHFATGMVHADPPDHTRLRRIVGHAFTNRTVQQLRPRIEQMVDDLLSAVSTSGRIDLIADLAYPLPATVIGELFGAPVQDADLFKKWSSGIGSFQGAGQADPEVMADATAAIVEMRDYFRALAAAKAAAPGDDLLSALVAPDAEPMTENELLSFCVTMLTAGHETTTSLIGSGMLALLSHPQAFAELQRRPETLETAVEELLRFDSPLQRSWRRVSTDTRFGGETMTEGELVVVFLGSANRDPDEFADADGLVIDREPNRHIGLGNGVHFCLGAPLARLEAQVAFRSLLHRFPDLALAATEINWNISGVFRCVRELPLTFTPVGRHQETSTTA